MHADAIIVGAGLAGLVAAAELGDRGKRVIILDQEGGQTIGGQAFWSLGGLFMVDTPEQRRLKIRDSRELALHDWLGSAQFDRPEDEWPRKVAEAYVDFAAGEMRQWLHAMGMRWFPVVGWAERRFAAKGHGNSVPRFHVTWGTGPAVVAPFERRVREHVAAGLVELRFRHRATRLLKSGDAITGVAGDVLADDNAERGKATNRTVTGEFELLSDAVIIASGGIGGNLDLVRKAWPAARLGKPPQTMVAGVPAHVDGAMIGIAEKAGGSVINRDRMWHYTEGLRNWDPIWANHGIRILPGPSSMWFDARGERLEAPFYPGFDSLGTLRRILSTGHDWSWFILTQKIIEKEFALSGSEQNPDLTGKDWKLLLKSRLLGKGAPAPVEAFKKHGADFIVRERLEDLVPAMNALSGHDFLRTERIREQIEARDAVIADPAAPDPQVAALHRARHYVGDKLIRTAKPHRILDPGAGPLIAVRLNILTRKTLGGLHTDLEARVLDKGGRPVPGLFAAGEAAGFGGGGYHGYNALEGTFLGGCIFSGRAAGRTAG